MLLHLTIKDFVIVDRLELEFSAGFGALTGETGAGKSILIDALALALGERAEAGVVRAGCDKAEVTAVFDVRGMSTVGEWLAANDFEAEDELLLRRVVDAGGRSRAYVNGSPATAQQLREVGEWLVDIHGQHAHQSLLRSDAQRQLLDAHAGLSELAREVGGAWRNWRSAEQALQSARSGSDQLQREREQLTWQIRDLEALALGEDEWPVLDAEHRRLAHSASLVEGVQYALGVLTESDAGCERQIDGVVDRLAELLDFDPELADVAGLMDSVRTELIEAVSALRRYADRVDLDPARFAELERRMDAVMSAARKYRVQPGELPALLKAWQGAFAALEAAADLAALEKQAEGARLLYGQVAQRLSEARAVAAGDMGEGVSALIRELALSSGRFEVALLPNESGAVHGFEQVEFRIAGLSGQEGRPLAKVASGGELSRISLAIQVLTSRSASVPTLIFDEVDVGIGGGVAEIVGRMLRQLGLERQVLCVTHLPQVAAQANWQWQVSKSTCDGVTLSEIRALDEAERVREIARMLGGVELTEITLQHASELLRSTAQSQ